MKKSEIQFLLNRIKTINREQGFNKLLIYFFNFILEQFIIIASIYKIELDKIGFIPRNTGLSFNVMGTHDIELIHLKHSDEEDENSYQNFLEKIKDPENNGFIIKKDNEIYGYCFIKYKNTYPVFKKSYVDVNYNGYLSYDYVFRKYRGQKIQQFCINQRLQLLKKKNFKTATVLILKNNYASVRSYEKFGFKKCVRLYFFQICGNRQSKKFVKIISK